MTVYRMLVAYDGTDFRGLAPNPGVRTVVGELARVMEPLLGIEPELVMSGRTDAGVHASGQVLSFEVDSAADQLDLDRIQRSINSRLGPEVVLRDITAAADDFSARFSATGRRYRYTIVNRPVADPLLARSAWWVSDQLDVSAMNTASGYLIGEHDFSSFCRRPKPGPGPDGVTVEPSMNRRVLGARWSQLGDTPEDSVLRFQIEGSAFCHQMVRSIVGFLVAVGSGKRSASELGAVLAARDRSAAEQPAPPHGLNLWQVDYEEPEAGSSSTP